MPRSLKIVIALLLVFGVGALADVLTALGSGVIKVTSGVLYLASAWGLARSSEFWRRATRLWLGIATMLCVALLVVGLGMVFKPSPPASGVAVLPWVMTIFLAGSIAINVWMIRALGSGEVRRWFADTGVHGRVAGA